MRDKYDKTITASGAAYSKLMESSKTLTEVRSTRQRGTLQRPRGCANGALYTACAQTDLEYGVFDAFAETQSPYSKIMGQTLSLLHVLKREQVNLAKTQTPK